MLASRNRASLALARPSALCVPERADLEGRDRMRQVVDRAGRAGEMQHVVDRPVDLDRLGDVVLDERKCGLLEQVGDVPPVAGQQVVDADDLVAVGEEPLAQVRADEPRPAGDHRSRHPLSPPSLMQLVFGPILGRFDEFTIQPTRPVLATCRPLPTSSHSKNLANRCNPQIPNPPPQKR